MPDASLQKALSSLRLKLIRWEKWQAARIAALLAYSGGLAGMALFPGAVYASVIGAAAGLAAWWPVWRWCRNHFQRCRELARRNLYNGGVLRAAFDISPVPNIWPLPPEDPVPAVDKSLREFLDRLSGDFWALCKQLKLKHG